MRKMVHYMSAGTLSDMCGVQEDGTPKLFPSQLVEVMASVLDNEVCCVIWNNLIWFCSPIDVFDWYKEFCM